MVTSLHPDLSACIRAPRGGTGWIGPTALTNNTARGGFVSLWVGTTVTVAKCPHTQEQPPGSMTTGEHGDQEAWQGVPRRGGAGRTHRAGSSTPGCHPPGRGNSHILHLAQESLPEGIWEPKQSSHASCTGLQLQGVTEPAPSARGQQRQYLHAVPPGERSAHPGDSAEKQGGNVKEHQRV